jgi:hypothetical protein
LPSDLLGQIKAVYDVIGPHIDMTLEQFEIDFMRDMHPQREVALWCGIAKAWLGYHEDFLGNEKLPNEKEWKLLGALVAIFSVSVHEVKGALVECARFGDEGMDTLPIRWPPAANLTGPEVTPFSASEGQPFGANDPEETRRALLYSFQPG